MAKNFYEKQCIRDNWSVRELKRQIKSALFQRIALSKDKKGVLELAQKGHIIQTSEDIIKDPYVLEFMGIPEDYRYSEKKLEQKIIDNLQMFLLELGKGFAFVGRQYRLTLNNQHYYVDLVFYHRILKCFVLINLKIGFVVEFRDRPISSLRPCFSSLFFLFFRPVPKNPQNPYGYILENNVSTNNYYGIFIWEFGTNDWPPEGNIFPAISFRNLAAAIAVMPSGSWRGLTSTISAPTIGPFNF